MAWNFRRRKKIAPGVYINMSKKGISTTVGPKGASMTFGPNGTYMNTSIPGTGLYNRKKIGSHGKQGATSQNSHSMYYNSSKETNTGCSSTGIITFILFVIGCFCLLMNDIVPMKFSLFVFILAGILLIVTMINSKIERKKREEYVALQELEAERIAKLPNYFDIKITEEQFNEVSKVCKSLDEFQNHILIYHSNFYDFLKSKGLATQTHDEICDAIKFMIYSDVYVSMEAMQSSMSIKDKEGFARIMLVSIINSSEEIEYSLLERLTEDIISNAESIGLGAKNAFGKNNNLTLPGLLKAYNEDLYLQYLICLYRFLSITAKADDVVKPAEADYLNNIMALLHQVDSYVNVKYDYIINWGTEVNLYESYDYSFDTISVGKYIVKSQKCVISDIQAELSISRDRVLKALKVLEDKNIIQTEGRTRKVLIQKESDLLRALRGESIVKGNIDISQTISPNHTPVVQTDDIILPHSEKYDPLLLEAAKYVVTEQVSALSALQRKFEVGYRRASKICDQLVEIGVWGTMNGEEGHEILVKDLKQLKEILKSHQAEPSPSKLKSSTSELDTLVGLASVKEEIKTLSNFIKIQQKRKEQGLKSSSVSYHCVFTGNPGTGKTTVARIVAQIYKDLGILSKGHLVETDRAGLVAEYVGQTAVKTNKIIDSALDGVLFIDEAYSLIGTGQDYGKEAIATLLKRMEDDRDRLVVILAGYSKEMQDFINTNPGLQSRFNRYIEFPDYSAEELLQIFEKNVARFDYKLEKDACMAMAKYFQNAVENKDANFGNARFVRNIFEKTLEKQANRLSTDPDLDTDELTLITLADLPIE
jgi:AAA+ superfamily predicted ATPase/predicted transcriptional regulator